MKVRIRFEVIEDDDPHKEDKSTREFGFNVGNEAEGLEAGVLALLQVIPLDSSPLLFLATLVEGREGESDTATEVRFAELAHVIVNEWETRQASV